MYSQCAGQAWPSPGPDIPNVAWPGPGPDPTLYGLQRFVYFALLHMFFYFWALPARISCALPTGQGQARARPRPNLIWPAGT